MKTIDEIKRALPFTREIVPGTLASEITLNGHKGSVVVGMHEDGYEHVSFSPYSKKLPTWNDLKELKAMFWNDDEEVYQIMPKASSYVNIKENCLHLWRPCNGKTLDDLAQLK